MGTDANQAIPGNPAGYFVIYALITGLAIAFGYSRILSEDCVTFG